MNNLKGKYVNVFLAIEMGRGMDFLKHPVQIAANFNGKLLESDLVPQNDCPIFNTELVWETEKKELRKVRSSNAPLRVKVVTIDDDQRKDRIGFALLNPRCASIVPFNSKLEIPFKWQKLLGVAAEHKSRHPELYLSLTIRDLCSAANPLESAYLSNITLDDDTETPSEESFEKDGQIVLVRYMPNGYIQIGNASSSETFLLSISIQVAYNLDLLLPEILVFHQSREKYYISFKMFGITIRSKPFCRDLHANIPMNEKIVIRLKSVYDFLKTYLTEFCKIIVNFSCGSDKLGTANLSVDSLLSGVSEEEFEMKLSLVRNEQKCFFKFPSVHGIIPSGSNGRQPHIEVETVLKKSEAPQVMSYMEKENEQENSTEEKIDLVNQEEIALHEELSSTEDNGCGDEGGIKEEEEHEQSPRVSACGDQSGETENFQDDKQKESEPESEECEEVESKVGEFNDDKPENHEAEDIQSTSSKSVSLKDESVEPPEEAELKEQQQELTETEVSEPLESSENQTKSSSTSIQSLAPARPKEITVKPTDFVPPTFLYQQYCLDVVLESITLKKPIQTTKLIFKFKHPKASSMVVSEAENRYGEDIILENIRCKIFFISLPEYIRKMVYAWPPKLIMADEYEQVITEELDLYTAMFLAKSRVECSYITEWKAVRTYEPLAKISISMYLQEYGLNALPNETGCELLPTILDEEVAVKELQALQEWKELQKVQFSADLKIMEKQRLSALQRNWIKRKKELEQTLNSSITRCRKLSAELQDAVNMVRTKRALQQKENEMNAKPNGSFRENLEHNAVKYSDYENKDLIETISKLERDNEHLTDIINEQRKEMQQIKKTALTKEQTTTLLQELRGLEEKFEDAQKAKKYFKNQWKQAVIEIHDLRAEDQKQIQERIKSQKVELSQLSLDSYLERNNFNYDGFNKSTSNSNSVSRDFKWEKFDFSKLVKNESKDV